MTDSEAPWNWNEIPMTPNPLRPKPRLISAAGWAWIALAIVTLVLAGAVGYGTNLAEYIQL